MKYKHPHISQYEKQGPRQQISNWAPQFLAPALGIVRSTSTKIMTISSRIHQSESATIKAPELYEYTHNERRSFDHLAFIDVTKRHSTAHL